MIDVPRLGHETVELRAIERGDDPVELPIPKGDERHPAAEPERDLVPQ
jgi:hypothetical protein